jgi:hypothetical protein
MRNTLTAGLIVENQRHVQGFTNESIARMMDMYREAMAKVPQMA